MQQIEHRPDCQLVTVTTYGLCTCDFDVRMIAAHGKIMGAVESVAPQTGVPTVGMVAATIVRRIRERKPNGDFVMSDAQADFAVRLQLGTLLLNALNPLDEG